MSVTLPAGSDTLLSKDHALLHRIIAVDPAAPEQSIVVDASGNAVVGTAVKFPDATTQTTKGLPNNYLDTDGTLSANSDSKVPSQKAVKTYVDTHIPSSTWPAYVKCSNTQATNANGGSASTSGFKKYPLNTKDSDTGSIATLSSNQITLPAGTYQVSGFASFWQTGYSQCRLYNITDSAELLVGSNVLIDSLVAVSANSIICGQFTISGTKTIEFQYSVTVSRSSNGLGDGDGTSPTNQVYGAIEFLKIA